jgi:hypothetical protein
MGVKRLGLIETLLDDGVVIFEEDLDKVENILKNDPDLITDIIKVHEFAKDSDKIAMEYIYPTKDNKLVYELAIYDARDVVFLSLDIDIMLDIKSKNLIISIAYPKEDEHEGD